MENSEKTKQDNPKNKGKGSSVWAIFMHADAVDKLLMALGFLGAAGNGFTTPIMLLITSKILNNLGEGSLGFNASFSHAVTKNAVSLLYLAFGSYVASFLEGYCWTRTGERQATKMRAEYLEAVLRQDVEYFDLKIGSTSDVVNGVSSDSLVVQDVLSEKVPNFIVNTSTFMGSYIVGFFMLWRLALVALPTALLLIIPGIMYGRILMSLARKIRAEYDKAGAIAEQAVSSVRTVYSFAAERRTMQQFSAALEGSVKLGVRQGLTKGVAIGSNGVTFAIWAFLVWYGSHLVMYHGSQGGTVFAVGASAIVGGLALGSGLSNVKGFSEAITAGERIMEVIRRVPKIDSYNDAGEVHDSVSGEVEYRSVEFSYPSRPHTHVLKDFNLRVPAGKTVALVGGSGSGKSTAIALLERFYDPAGGMILMDGVDIRRLQLRWLRSQMGLVSQEPALFATSIKENILFGKEDATMEEIITAAKVSNAHDFISQLPQGYDTQVGERGVQMSGGQKQRIAIARAILKSPKILLLDEATSALDSESERVVQEALDKASAGRTTIVIAHRLSTIRNADLIAVVQSGHVIESGSHENLIGHHGGVYSSLIRLQESSSPAPTDFAAATSLSLSTSRKFSAVSACSSRSFDGDNQIVADHQQLKREEDKPVPSFRRLLMLNSPEWRNAVMGCISAVMFGAVQPLYAYSLGSMIALYFIKDHDEMKRKTRAYSLFFTSLAVFSFVVNMGQHYNFGVMGEYLTKRVRERMLSKMLTFEVGWFDQDENSTGAVCSRLTRDANVVRSLVGDRIALVVQTMSAVTLAFTLGLVIAPKLAAVMIAVQPMIIVCFYARRVLLKQMSAKALKSQSESSKLAAEAVANIRTVAAFSSRQRILHLFALAQSIPRRQSRRHSWLAGLGLAFSQGLTTCTWALDFWYGGRLVADGTITAKALFQTFLILVSTGKVIADAGSMTTDLSRGSDTVASVFAILDRVTRIDPEEADGIQPENITGAVDIRAVDFSYPTRPENLVLCNFSLSIRPGKSTALVGQSGSGKSTVIGLIERFYDPIKGTIKIDGKDIRSYNLRELRKHIGLVGQEPVLFAGTVRDNIIYGNENATEEEIEAAARAANAHDFIGGLKDGYATLVGERGAQLSGGQKQRIAIARAIVKNPAILLLDEATSALDTKAERVVQEALERVMVGRTSIVVAHRLSTVRNCDAIAVVDNGSIVEKGTHATLMANGSQGAYYQLVSLQLGRNNIKEDR